MSDFEIKRAFTNTPWEAEVGYCLALRAGPHIWVTGCAPVAEGGGTHTPGDAYARPGAV